LFSLKELYEYHDAKSFVKMHRIHNCRRKFTLFTDNNKLGDIKMFTTVSLMRQNEGDISRKIVSE